MKFDKDITKIKGVTFFETHCIYNSDLRIKAILLPSQKTDGYPTVGSSALASSRPADAA